MKGFGGGYTVKSMAKINGKNQWQWQKSNTKIKYKNQIQKSMAMAISKVNLKTNNNELPWTKFQLKTN